MAINQAFTATGISPELPAKEGAFSISGTFVGTIELQRELNFGADPGTFQTIASFTAPTSVGDDVSFDNGVVLPMRFEVTAFTSGTITAILEGGVGSFWTGS